jgi:hypothetical protein
LLRLSVDVNEKPYSILIPLSIVVHVVLHVPLLLKPLPLPTLLPLGLDIVNNLTCVCVDCVCVDGASDGASF